MLTRYPMIRLMIRLTLILLILTGCNSSSKQAQNTESGQIEVAPKDSSVTSQLVNEVTGKRVITQGETMVNQLNKSADKHNEQLESTLKEADEKKEKTD